jgi:hypothetical protein
MAGIAGCGRRFSHSRWFWGLRLHLVCTLAGLPITWALALPASTNARSSWPCSTTTSPCWLDGRAYDTLEGRLDLELHGGRSLAGVAARAAQRLLVLTAATWHNRATAQSITRSLIAYDQ